MADELSSTTKNFADKMKDETLAGETGYRLSPFSKTSRPPATPAKFMRAPHFGSSSTFYPALSGQLSKPGFHYRRKLLRSMKDVLRLILPLITLY